jgi:hypothetical protein
MRDFAADGASRYPFAGMSPKAAICNLMIARPQAAHEIWS